MRSAADALDRERKERGPAARLHGIPILIKTTSRLRIAWKQPRDLGVGRIKPLRMRPSSRDSERQALTLGKTNLSEWANFRSLGRQADGAVAAVRRKIPTPWTAIRADRVQDRRGVVGICARAVGTETDGRSSVRRASADRRYQTDGRPRSRSGIIPISASQDTAGPMARTVADAAALLTVIAGMDAGSRYTRSKEGVRTTPHV